MKKIYFEVKLLSDIIINQKAATEGPNSTLDFIPGSNFLGIAAGAVYKEISELEAQNKDTSELKELAWDLFHSGNVHFGDAHQGENGNRSNKVPTAMFYPKLSKASEKLYISHLIPNDKKVQEEVKSLQLRQCRNGFYVFVDGSNKPLKPNKEFAIKSAHDKFARTSKDAKLFGYQSLSSDDLFYFDVECEEKYEGKLIGALEGIKRVGRSRSSQYGLVKITKLAVPYNEVKSVSRKGTVVIYADSRLIFLDKENGCPTFRPRIEQLGLKTGEICWEMSQIRTFQYAPWNFARQCFDTDRCGMEKGSVIVVNNVEECPSHTQYVGSYNNEGFGRVIYNPSFLEGDAQTGLAYNTLAETVKPELVDTVVEDYDNSDSLLLTFLKESYWNEYDEQYVYEQVNNWVEKNTRLFAEKDSFASQWGVIRTIATQCRSRNEIMTELFDKVVVINSRDRFGNPRQEKANVAYLVHGVARDKWKGERLKALRSFCEEDLADFHADSHFRFFRMAIINLAAEMAKRCRKEYVR